MERMNKPSGWRAVAGVVMAAGAGAVIAGGLAGCPSKEQGPVGDPNSAPSASSESTRSSIVGRWKLDLEASRQEMVSGYRKAAASEGLAENLIEDYGDDADAFANDMLERFGPVRFEFKEDGVWEISFEGEDGGGETGEWVKKDGYWIMDPDSPRPQRLELHGESLHMIQQGEDVRYFYEGFKMVFEPA